MLHRGSGRRSDPLAEAHPLTAGLDARSLDAVIAAQAGFCAVGALMPASVGQRAVTQAKLELAVGFLNWLIRRHAVRRNGPGGR